MNDKQKRALQAVVYWLIHAIWAFPTFVIGLLVALVMLLSWHRPYIFGFDVYFKVSFIRGAGSEFGPFFVISDDCENNLQMKCHEHGHGIQALWWGPLTLLVISIPSLLRFWGRRIKEASMSKKLALLKITREQYNSWRQNYPDYDDVWFEGQATRLGLRYFA